MPMIGISYISRKKCVKKLDSAKKSKLNDMV